MIPDGRMPSNVAAPPRQTRPLSKSARHWTDRTVAFASAAATRSVVATATSGFNEIESMPSLTNQVANSG
jgi:hypothetical protein